MGLNSVLKLRYEISGEDFSSAGEASSSVKKNLTKLGIPPVIIKKAAVSMYEAEINAVIHAGGGFADVEISEAGIVISIVDRGPGIPDVNLAMQEGYSTAPDSVRELGFGAGMGLPNIKRYSDELLVNTIVGKGTEVIIRVNIS